MHVSSCKINKVKIISKKIKGDGIGSREVVPTINLIVPQDLPSILERGIYAAWCKIGKKNYKTALHFGPRPTYKKSYDTLELYILDKYKANSKVENGEIEVEIVKKIRNILDFNTSSELRAQIVKDVQDIEKILRNMTI
ncbi:MAG: riboflavin kinase [Patescibacteria group bacterium]